MKLILPLVFPFVCCFFLYSIFYTLGFDFCSFLKKTLLVSGFYGANYFECKIVECFFYGSMVSSVLFCVPFFMLVYRFLDVGRIAARGIKIDVKKTLFSSFFLLFCYALVLFSPVESYSGKFSGFVLVVLENFILFYLLLILPSQLIVGMWALCLKLKFHTFI